MHRASSSILTLSASDAGAGPPPGPGSRVEHLFWADWNAGACGLIPAPIWTPPPGPGSGKFGTPCERMQSAYLMPADSLLELEVPLGVPDDPHPASTIVQLAAATRSAVSLRTPLGTPGFLLALS